MIVVAVASLLFAALVVAGALGALRWQARAHDRKEQGWQAERRDLLDRLMYLVDKPWESPAYARREEEQQDEYDTILRQRGIMRDPENYGDLEAQSSYLVNGHRQPELSELT